jgi:hypothetical protein
MLGFVAQPKRRELFPIYIEGSLVDGSHYAIEGHYLSTGVFFSPGAIDRLMRLEAAPTENS